MLVVGRRRYESILIDGKIRVYIVEIRKNHECKIGVDAPDSVRVERVDVNGNIERRKDHDGDGIITRHK